LIALQSASAPNGGSLRVATRAPAAPGDRRGPWKGVNQFQLRRSYLVGPELLRLPVRNAPLLTAGGDGGTP